MPMSENLTDCSPDYPDPVIFALFRPARARACVPRVLITLCARARVSGSGRALRGPRVVARRGRCGGARARHRDDAWLVVAPALQKGEADAHAHARAVKCLHGTRTACNANYLRVHLFSASLL
eukprot:6201769-Pleurochrysis_carterae.AAC.1